MYDLATKYFFLFKDIHTYLLLHLIEEYVNGAEIQIHRIDRTRSLFQKTFKSYSAEGNLNMSSYRKRHLQLFCDVHFYFICIGQVSKCLDRFCSELKNSNLFKINSEFQKVFQREIRNDLEHLDARAVGKKKKGRKEVSIGHIRDFRNLSNDFFTFNGRAYPLNRESLKKLKGFYKRIISVIHKDYGLKDSIFVDNIKRDKYLKKVSRIAQNEYRNYLLTKQVSKT